MNLGWIRHLFTLSEIEKGRIREPAPDPRRIESFQDIESMVQVSLIPAASPTQLLQAAISKTPARATARSLLDQDLLKKLLRHRPNYTSGRILRADTEGTS